MYKKPSIPYQHYTDNLLRPRYQLEINHFGYHLPTRSRTLAGRLSPFKVIFTQPDEFSIHHTIFFYPLHLLFIFLGTKIAYKIIPWLRIFGKNHTFDNHFADFPQKYGEQKRGFAENLSVYSDGLHD